MDIQSIIITNIIGIFLLVLLIISNKIQYKNMHTEDKYLLALVLGTIACCFSEMYSFMVDGKPGNSNRIANFICNHYLFMSTIILPIFWNAFVAYKLHRSKKRLKRVFGIFIIPGIIICIAILFTTWTGWFFTISPDNVYSRGPYSNLMLIYGLLEVGHSVFSVFRNNHNKRFALFFPIWVFVVPIFIAAILQLIFYGISIFWCSVSIGIIAVNMSLQNENSYVDELTGLLNRKYLASALQETGKRKKYVYSGVMIDIDDFKKINDTFGHSVGDDAIREAAHILSDTIPNNATAIRYAGDEFILLMRSESTKDVELLMDEVRSALTKFNASKKKPYKLSFSMGSSIYYDAPNALDIFLKTMDSNMYIEKNKKHNRV